MGIALGGMFGLLLGVVASFQYTTPAYLGLAVGTSVFAVMAMSATAGTMIPMLLKRLNVDAAIATGPFITTFIDVLGISLFFSVAKFLLDL